MYLLHIFLYSHVGYIMYIYRNYTIFINKYREMLTWIVCFKKLFPFSK